MIRKTKAIGLRGLKRRSHPLAPITPVLANLAPVFVNLATIFANLLPGHCDQIDEHGSFPPQASRVHTSQEATVLSGKRPKLCSRTSLRSRITPVIPKVAPVIPHMGWNDVMVRPHAPLLDRGEAYFLHSYHFVPEDGHHALAMTDHGGGLVAAVGRDTIMGVQFHPEKSQAYGLALLRSFLEWKP